MPQPSPFDLSPSAVRTAYDRLGTAQRKLRSGHLGPLEKWSRESRYWSLRPTLFDSASGLEYQAVLRYQREYGAPHFDPKDRSAARIRALTDLETAKANGSDLAMVVLDHWNYWLHFPELVGEIFGLDIRDLQAMVARFDRDLTEAVRDYDAEVRRSHEEQQRAFEAAQEEVADRESRRAALMEDPPCPHRMQAEMLDQDRLKLRLKLTDEDLRGHPQLMHPMLTGLWELFEPHAEKNGLFVDHRNGVFEVITSEIAKIDAFLEDFSSGIEEILELDRRRVGPLSLSKAADLLDISRRDLEQLVSVGELSPISIVTLTSGNLMGVQFLAFAAQDVLDLKAVLDGLYQPSPVAGTLSAVPSW